MLVHGCHLCTYKIVTGVLRIQGQSRQPSVFKKGNNGAILTLMT